MSLTVQMEPSENAISKADGAKKREEEQQQQQQQQQQQPGPNYDHQAKLHLDLLSQLQRQQILQSFQNNDTSNLLLSALHNNSSNSGFGLNLGNYMNSSSASFNEGNGNTDPIGGQYALAQLLLRQKQQQELVLLQQIQQLKNQQLLQQQQVAGMMPLLQSAQSNNLLRQSLLEKTVGGLGNLSSTPGNFSHSVPPAATNKFSVLSKRKHSDMSDSASENSTADALPPPPAHKRIKGHLYLVKGRRKKWDGKRFARCCSVLSCDKLAQGTTEWCKNHGGGTRCSMTGCGKAARGGSTHCAAHGGGRRCSYQNCNRVAVGNSFCRTHGGGKTCHHAGCGSLASSKSGLCSKHTEISICMKDGCKEKVGKQNLNGIQYCDAHFSEVSIAQTSQAEENKNSNSFSEISAPRSVTPTLLTVDSDPGAAPTFAATESSLRDTRELISQLLGVVSKGNQFSNNNNTTGKSV